MSWENRATTYPIAPERVGRAASTTGARRGWLRPTSGCSTCRRWCRCWCCGGRGGGSLGPGEGGAGYGLRAGARLAAGGAVVGAVGVGGGAHWHGRARAVLGRAVAGRVGGGVYLRAKSLSSCPYSPECVAGSFSELRAESA